MTDGLNNPNELPDDDWAMSESEVPLKKEPQPKPIDEKAASLYAPPDTGELEDWDLSTNDAPSIGATPPPPPNIKPQAFDKATAFVPPQKALEILKPVAPPKFKDEDWGIASSPKNDGWKMPEPVFRATEGEILTKVRRSSPKLKKSAPAPQAAAPQTAQEQERLPDIYAPPDTQESDSEDFHISDTQEEIPEIAELNQASPATGNVSEQKPAKSKKFMYVVLGFLFAGVLIIIVLAAVFGFMFYKSAP